MPFKVVKILLVRKKNLRHLIWCIKLLSFAMFITLWSRQFHRRVGLEKNNSVWPTYSVQPKDYWKTDCYSSFFKSSWNILGKKHTYIYMFNIINWKVKVYLKYSLLRESLSKTGPLRFGSENQFPLTLPMNISWSKSNWKGISFWKYFKMKFLGTKIDSAPGGHFFALTKSKNSAYCRVYNFKVFRFQRFFPLLRFKLVLKRCKAHNFEPSKATHI